MTVQHVLSVVSVRDLAAAEAFYARLLDRAPDNRPMPSLVEWQVVPGAWVQAYVDPGLAGSSRLNLAVDDLDAEREALRARGLDPQPVVEASRGVRLCALTDPDGNVVTVIGGFRVEY
ncbi:VOC family protein [Vallicoccus soli]|uniref:VOC family protein n=1 Tax=Vallicoccus soli TaxID=2339232 RepID=A0A3A3ZL82_9ACTN|nr:VOC family protein [Vallicoccus soli]RJK96872.1 VOC family protein [Vallicoccus soli]